MDDNAVRALSLTPVSYEDLMRMSLSKSNKNGIKCKIKQSNGMNK